jgi:hypothetical protein
MVYISYFFDFDFCRPDDDDGYDDDDDDDDDDDEERRHSIYVDLTQDCPTVHLPILLLNEINMKSIKTYGVLQSARGTKVCIVHNIS